MTHDQIYFLLRDVVQFLAKNDKQFTLLPENLDPSATLSELGLDLLTLPDIRAELVRRLGGRTIDLDAFFDSEVMNTATIQDLLQAITQSFHSRVKNPMVVYVDDEEENLFIFKRKFGSTLNLKLIQDPQEALRFIKDTPEVALVITDEVMPVLNGNALLEKVREVKPTLPFILITGNPQHDDNLVHRSLRENRFYEFIQKPVDFDGSGPKYLALFKRFLE